VASLNEPEDLAQAAAASSPGPAPEPIPWEDSAVPRLAGLLATVWEGLVRPTKFFRGMPREGWEEALAFGLILGSFGLLATVYWDLLLGGSLAQAVQKLSGSTWLVALGLVLVMFSMLLVPLLVLAGLLLGSLCLLGGVRLAGGEAPAFTPCLRLSSYAQVALVAGILPIVGGWASTILGLILVYKGVRGVFGMSAGRALGAVAFSFVLQAVALLAVVALFALPLLFLGLT